MARYIDADKLVLWCNETYQVQSTSSGKAYVNAFLTKVLSCPTANVAPIADTIDEIKTRFALHYGTYCYDDVTKLKDVFSLLNLIEKEIVKGGDTE